MPTSYQKQRNPRAVAHLDAYERREASPATAPGLVCAVCGAPLAERDAAPAPDGEPLRFHEDFNRCLRLRGVLAPHLANYIHSEQPKDEAHARAECAELGINYVAAKRQLTARMIAESRALLERQERGESKTREARQ